MNKKKCKHLWSRIGGPMIGAMGEYKCIDCGIYKVINFGVSSVSNDLNECHDNIEKFFSKSKKQRLKYK